MASVGMDGMAAELVYDKESVMTEKGKRAILMWCCIVLIAILCFVLALTASVAGAAADSPLPTPTAPTCQWPICFPTATATHESPPRRATATVGVAEPYPESTVASPLPTASSPLPTVASPLPTPIIPDQTGPLPTPTVSYREDCDLCLRLVQSGLVGAWECLQVCDDTPTECGVYLITEAGDACYE